MMRFKRKSILAPKYVVLYEIVERVVRMAYKLASSTSIDHIHDVFQVLSLLKYTGNLSHMLRIGEI